MSLPEMTGQILKSTHDDSGPAQRVAIRKMFSCASEAIGEVSAWSLADDDVMMSCVEGRPGEEELRVCFIAYARCAACRMLLTDVRGEEARRFVRGVFDANTMRIGRAARNARRRDHGAMSGMQRAARTGAGASQRRRAVTGAAGLRDKGSCHSK